MRLVHGLLQGASALTGGVDRVPASPERSALYAGSSLTTSDPWGRRVVPLIEVLEGRRLLSAGGEHAVLGACDDSAVAAQHREARHSRRDARNFTSTLSGDQEVPPRQTIATGQAKFQLSRDGRTLYFKLEVGDIENVVGAHLHLGAAGVNGPIVVGLYSAEPAGGPVNGVLARGAITASDLEGPLVGKTMADLVREIKAGNIYVNVHTNDGSGTENTGPGNFASGEIRGQVKMKDRPHGHRRGQDNGDRSDDRNDDRRNDGDRKDTGRNDGRHGGSGPKNGR